MLIKQIILSNKLGLHARATLKLVDTADQFKSDIIIHFQHKSVNAKNIMDLMSLGASCGSLLEIQADGEDEDEALNAILHLIEDRFDEE